MRGKAVFMVPRFIDAGNNFVAKGDTYTVMVEYGGTKATFIGVKYGWLSNTLYMETATKIECDREVIFR